MTTPHPTLVNRVLRHLAVPDAAVDALAVLPALMSKDLRRDVLRDAAHMRATLVNSRRMVLGNDFTQLCARFVNEASVREVWSVMRFAQAPFDSMWMEWCDINTDTGEPEPYPTSGLLIQRTPEADDGLGGSLRVVQVYEVPDRRARHLDGRAITVLPLSLRLRFAGDPFDPKLSRGLTLKGGMFFKDGEIDAEALYAASERLFPVEWIAKAKAEAPDVLREVLCRVALLPLETSGAFMFSGAKHDGPYREQFVQQTAAAANLARTMPLTAGVALGMMSLHSVRHVVATRDFERHPDAPANNWRWKHDHKVVTIVRPITVREVVRHLREGESHRKAAALHDVIGHWRVRGGRPSCNHRWKAHVDDKGKQIGSSQHLCTECAAVRCWVRNHARGTPEQGMLTKEYVVETHA